METGKVTDKVFIATTHHGLFVVKAPNKETALIKCKACWYPEDFEFVCNYTLVEAQGWAL